MHFQETENIRSFVEGSQVVVKFPSFKNFGVVSSLTGFNNLKYQHYLIEEKK